MKLRITVDSKTYEVDVEVAEDDRNSSGPVPYYAPRAATPAPVVVPTAAAPAAGGANQPVADESKVCRSPVAGIVVRLNSKPGQQIQANDLLLVLEAMKMETNVTSPVAGKVKAINVNMGDGVQVGQVLVEFE